MTKLEQMTRTAIREFMQRETSRIVQKVSHVYPRGYVLCRPAAACLIVALPIQDAEPHMKRLKQKGDNSTIVHLFDDELKAGDWCSLAYVSCGSTGEHVAVKAVG